MGQKYLLLIDENPDDVYLTLRELRGLEPDVRVHVITDSAVALSYLKEAKELPAALLLGLKFIRLSGLELLSELRSLPQTRRLPVVMLTASRDERERVYQSVMKSKPVACLNKPVEGTAVAQVLDTLGIRVNPPMANRSFPVSHRLVTATS